MIAGFLRSGSTVLTLVFFVVPMQALADNLPVLGCLLEPTTTADLSSSSRGKVDEILVQRGDVVKVGDVLAKLETGVEKLNVDLATTKAGMRMDLEAKEARLQLSERNEQRIRELAKKNMMSSMQLDEAVTETTIAGLDVLQAREQTALAQMELQRAKELLRQRYIHSTVNGIVVELYKEVGEFVDEEPVLKLAELDPLKVDVIAPVTMFGQIEPGMVLIVSPELPELGPYTAEVDVVDRIIDAGSGTFRFSLVLPNPDFNIPAGLNCELSLATDAE